MNRIYRLVWNHRLNALVVVSEIATARGSLAAGPVVIHLKVPLKLLALGLACALGSGSALAAESQTRADLDALTNKYLPVQIDAEAALDARLGTAQGTSSAMQAQVSVLADTARVRPKVVARIQAALPQRPQLPDVKVDTRLNLDPQALGLQVAATVDAEDALRASVDAGIAGGTGIAAATAQVEIGDRNDKRVSADVSAQTNALSASRNGLVGGLLGGGVVNALPPGSPKAPGPVDPNAGLIIGTGGLTGSLGQLVGPTAQNLFGGDGYVRNGNLAVSSANVMQTYSVTNVLGIPTVNLSPVGTLLNGLGGATTGGNSHLTLIGGVTSDSYIYNINNGDPNGLLGLILPGQAPAWANTCLDLAVADIQCWALNPAQDYQVLMGDGAYANGSREVVIGANARHALPQVDASVAFPGAGLNDPTDPTGVPTADYAARLGHSVVVGDSALGTANGQVLLGAEARSSQANSVALGFRSVADRGAQASYGAYGLTAAQVSAGEVSVGFAGGERQISNVAAGSAATDAVNVAQLQGAIAGITTAAANIFAVSYDDNGAGQPDYTRVTLGNGAGPTAIGNLADGAVEAGSTEAINGGQLFQTHATLASYFGGSTAYDGGTGTWTPPSFAISSFGYNGSSTTTTYGDVSAAFAAVDASLNVLNTRIDLSQPSGTASLDPYVRVNSFKTAAVASGADSIAVGPVAAASGTGSVAIGDGATASADNSVALGAGSIADRDNAVSVGSADTVRQITHVGDGTEATDAVNVRQLQAAQQGTIRYDTTVQGATNYNSVTLGAPASGPTVVHNVGAGTAGTDAVNVDQLRSGMSQTLDSARAYTDERMGGFDRDLRRTDNRASAGVAAAMAVAGLPQPYEAGRSMAAIAAGSYNGESGVAVGLSGVSDGGRWIYKVSGSTNSRGEGGVSVGAGIQW
jgi:trimeric autotransporter adhesin